MNVVYRLALTCFLLFFVVSADGRMLPEEVRERSLLAENQIRAAAISLSNGYIVKACFEIMLSVRTFKTIDPDDVPSNVMDIYNEVANSVREMEAQARIECPKQINKR